MAGARHEFRMTRLAWLLCAAASVAGCDAAKSVLSPPGGLLALGTWGGDNTGVIATDSLTHVHVGCTYGDMPGRLALDSTGRFDVAGSFLLRAYPVAVGPSLPARFAGRVVGSTITLTVTVNDTVEKKSVVLGPVTAVFGQEPRLGPCPICRVPGRRATLPRSPQSRRP